MGESFLEEKLSESTFRKYSSSHSIMVRGTVKKKSSPVIDWASNVEIGIDWLGWNLLDLQFPITMCSRTGRPKNSISVQQLH